MGGDCDGNGVAEAALDEARCKQAKGGHQTTAVYAVQLVLAGDLQLECA